jgi:hypothetical protein
MFTTISFPPLHMRVLSLNKSYGNTSRDSWVHEHIAYPEFPCFFSLVSNMLYFIQCLICESLQARLFYIQSLQWENVHLLVCTGIPSVYTYVRKSESVPRYSLIMYGILGEEIKTEI